MTTNRKIVQLSLVFIGVLLLLITYIFYPKIMEKKNITSNKKEEIIITNEQQDNTFENVEYKGMYDLDKPFTVKSKQAYILTEEPNIVYMTDMRVTLHMSDGRIIIITSDQGSYNKHSYDCFFEDNVKATDGKTTILSKNLDLLATKDSAKVYNDVVLIHGNNSLKADKIDYDFVSKYYHISMFENNKKVKIKLIE